MLPHCSQEKLITELDLDLGSWEISGPGNCSMLTNISIQCSFSILPRFKKESTTLNSSFPLQLHGFCERSQRNGRMRNLGSSFPLVLTSKNKTHTVGRESAILRASKAQFSHATVSSEHNTEKLACEYLQSNLTVVRVGGALWHAGPRDGSWFPQGSQQCLECPSAVYRLNNKASNNQFKVLSLQLLKLNEI